MNHVCFSMLFTSLLMAYSIPIVCAEEGAKSPAPITAVAITPDGKQAITGSQAGVEILAWPTLKPQSRIGAKLVHVHDAQFSPDGKRLLLAGGAPGELGTLELWSWPELQLVASASPHSDLIYKASWSPSGGEIAAASADGHVKIVSGKSLDSQQTYEGHSRSVLSAIWFQSGDQILSASVDQTIQHWNATDCKRLRTLPNHLGSVNELAFRPDSDERLPILASISEDRTLRLWQPTNHGRMVRFITLPSPPRTLAWTSGGDQLIIAANDGVVRVLDFDELKVQREIPGQIGRIYSLALHPKEPKVLIGGQKGVEVLDIEEAAAN
jgi:WD40 repeat protein